ncbi:cell division protein ZapD [Thiohalobacter sp. IOR34]|uniref:cell division protein ZapD n=1 Tax=Thiohalobacter sp. IOR34 TaxID=3057176 RepID=UPI0025B25FC0|nr:cell division protein ZapD [Thiohalobacter sp. IOR34]WJW74937.1 cell division protein ZapD [Thiohalobacter sp. IOR34]
MSHKVIYEQPLNERIRAFLRLESLFQQVRHHLGGTLPWDSRSTISSMLDIMNIFSRSDLKTEVMKELDRHTANLARLEQNPDVDRAQLAGLLDEIDTLIDELHAINGPIGAHLKGNEFLASIQQRSAIPGGTCDFDLPGYHYWLQLPAEDRIRDLAAWLECFDVIGRAVRLILRLTRGSTLFRAERAEAGFFQKSLDPNVPCQMVRVALPAGSPCFAEISGGRHRFTVRFMEQPSVNERAAQTGDNIDFELACCII